MRRNTGQKRTPVHDNTLKLPITQTGDVNRGGSTYRRRSGEGCRRHMRAPEMLLHLGIAFSRFAAQQQAVTHPGSLTLTTA